MVPPSSEPAARTAGGVAATGNAEMASSGPSKPGGTRSAGQPPDHVPAAMAARADPMTMVLVSRVSPRYGAEAEGDELDDQHGGRGAEDQGRGVRPATGRRGVRCHWAILSVAARMGS